MVPPLDQLRSLIIDEGGFWHRPEYPEYKLQLAAPKAFLVPSFDEGVVEVLPTEKQNRKINFVEEVNVLEIENRFQMMELEDVDDDDESYEIEIVEGSGAGSCEDDADFYLEMIDGEIFYVFETEDDISISDEESSSDGSSDSSSSSESEMQTPTEGPVAPLQFNFGELMAPTLDDSMVHLNASFELVDFTDEEENNVSEIESKLSENGKPHDNYVEKSIVGVANIADEPESPDHEAKPTIGLDTPAVSPTPSIGCPSSPSSPTKTKKKPKKERKEKTFTKTFVRASDFDGEHRVFSWETPTWANTQLKSTGKGDCIRQGANLSAPITHAQKLIESGKVKWEKPEWARNGDESEQADDVDATEELIRKIQDGTVSLPGLRNNKRRLKLSVNGSVLAKGGDIVKPITKATIIRKPSNINFLANPKILRATPGGQKLWKGENLAGPVTQATTVKKYEWEKPSWAKTNLNQTDAGGKVKAGKDMAAPITKATDNESPNSWDKPDWANRRGVSRAHSEIAGASKKEYTWEKPSWAKPRFDGTSGNLEGALATLKPTEKGQLAFRGVKLEKPITSLPHMTSASVDSQSQSDKPGIRRTKSHDGT